MRDYANKKPTRNRKRSGWWAYVFIGIAITIPIAMFYSRYQNIIHNKGRVPKKSIAKKQSQPPPKKPQSEFDFYTLLPKMRVPVPQAQTALPVVSNQQKSSYILQVASVKSLADAKRFRDQLFAMGFRAFIQTTGHDTTPWYRIVVGPYLSMNQALSVQRQLHKDKMESLLLKMKS